MSNAEEKSSKASTDKLPLLRKRMQNYAARVIVRLPKSSSITIHLK